MSLQPQAINSVNELGHRLNQAVHQERRGEFGLLLSMLAADQPWDPQADQPEVCDEEQMLRQQFQLPPKQALQDNEELNRAESYGEIFHEQGLEQLRLMHALQPPPLRSPVRRPRQISNDVLANVDTINRNRHIALSV